jgi:branched-chain amino acid transport system permease protein
VMHYFSHVFNYIVLYGILAASLDLVAGQAGLLSLSHAAFFGIGAYASGLLSAHFGMPFTVGATAGMLLAALASAAVSLPSLRLHDDYFTIATFAFQLVVTSILTNWMAVTDGPLGVSGIPAVSLLGWSVNTPERFALFSVVLGALIYAVLVQLEWSPFGRVVNGIREDEVFVRAVGKNPLVFKVKIVAVSAALAALAGSLYAHYTSFTVSESILMISMVIIGGAGSHLGPVLGAAVLILLPEVLRFVGLPAASAANLRQILYGIGLVLMLIVRPQGLVGTYAFGRRDDTGPVL